MKEFSFTGKTVVLGDLVDTDAILPARFLGITEERELGKHFMEDLYPGLSTEIEPGSILIAGSEFGCGSSREHAPLAIKGVGFQCIVAKSFSRIFYRNAINIGLPVITCDKLSGIIPGSMVSVDCRHGKIKIESTGEKYVCSPLPEFILDILTDGGLIANLEKRLLGN